MQIQGIIKSVFFKNKKGFNEIIELTIEVEGKSYKTEIEHDRFDPMMQGLNEKYIVLDGTLNEEKAIIVDPTNLWVKIL